MKKSVMLSALVAALTGCVSQEAFVKNGITYSKYEQDDAICQTKSTQEVAVNRSPGAEVAVALFTGVYAVQDANAVARASNYNSCMISKGYQRIELPLCTNAKTAKETGVGPLTATKKIEVAANSCYALDTRGRMVFAQQ